MADSDLVSGIDNFKRGARNLYNRLNQPGMGSRDDPSWHDDQVRAANRSFQQKAEADRAAAAAAAAAVAKTPVKRTPKRTATRTAAATRR